MTQTTDYRLKSIMDFLSVPEEKVDACLSDFKQWIAFYRTVKSIPVPEELGRVELEPSFHWRDDDISGLSEINVKIVMKKPDAV